MVATIVVASVSLALIRTGGFTSGFDHDLHWRWTPTPEERLLADARNAPAPAPAAPAPALASAEIPKETPAIRPAGEPAPTVSAARVAEWPGFRGLLRDGVVRGVRIDTDWSNSPPVELWRRPVGPGWSSFAVQGDLIYTQEQRGEDEVVSSYKATTGAPVWLHRDAARFWESNGGAGPRGTPTLSNGRLYALGATGVLNALDSRSGAVIWSRNAAAAAEAPVPDWGFSSSPVVVDDVVVIATGGRLSAYDIATGKPRWIDKRGGFGYSSPHLATVGGVQQILFLGASGAISVSPGDGSLLWEHAWPGGVIVQPAVISDGDILIATLAGGMGGAGTRRIGVTRGAAGWAVEERWTSTGLKPYFNDYVIHKGYVYGFDGSILASVDINDGTRKWKGGRYGSGQLVLLADQDLLLVISEEGDLALVNATPDRFTEVARFRVLDGKTWNHPVVVGDVLFVRNSEEMAAFRLPAAK